MVGAEPVSYRAWTRPAEHVGDDVWDAVCREFERVRHDLGRQGLFACAIVWLSVVSALALVAVLAELAFAAALDIDAMGWTMGRWLGIWGVFGAAPAAGFWGAHRLRQRLALLRLEAAGRAIGWTRADLWQEALGSDPAHAAWVETGAVGPMEGHGAGGM